MNVSSHPELAEQFDDPKQQRNAASLGMWVFIASEVLFFGGLFLAYTVYRIATPEEFAQAAQQLNIVIGTINTAILLLSSYFIAVSLSAIKAGQSRYTLISLLIAWFLGLIFLLLKVFEYYDDIEKNLLPTKTLAKTNGEQIFYVIYYIITGVHALHLIIGLGMIMLMIVCTYRKNFSKNYFTPIELTGLYWHFVDVVWIFIYPSLYLLGRH